VSVMIRKVRLRWFGCIEGKDNNNWFRRCAVIEVERVRQMRYWRKIWWDGVI